MRVFAVAGSSKLFPEGFLWGSSTASFQVEGHEEHSDWTEALRAGKLPEMGLACDQLNRYEEDFDLAQEMGHNAHRLSLEWARIEPREGEFQAEAIAHYRKVLKALKARGIQPMVTLWHYTMPAWFAKKGGFLQPEAAEIFARYCRFVVEALGDECDLWMTMNEPEVYVALSYLIKTWPPFRFHPWMAYKIYHRLAEAHNRAFVAMKEVRPGVQVGLAKHNIFFESNGFFVNKLLHYFADWLWNHDFLARVKGHLDYIGLNQYVHWKFGGGRERARNPISEMGFEIYPEAVYHCLVDLKRYGLPVYITEHGIADGTDTLREPYLRDSLSGVHRAIVEGVPVKGYLYWSLIDNYEWHLGFTKRFGLIEMDQHSRERKIRPSARYFAGVCRGNGLVG